MKHPALTRFMSTVLAIMCVIMLAAGIFNIGAAKEQLAADEKVYDKLVTRIETYEQLTAKLDGVEPSKAAREKLDARQEQHDKDASDYRMDLAERGATQGGYKMGADKLWEADAKLKEGEFQYKSGRAQFEQKAAEFAEQKKQAGTMISAAEGMAAQCAGLAASKPVAPVAPVEPVAPTVPGQDASEEELEAYNKALAEYNDACSKYQEDIEKYKVEHAEYEKELAAYNAKAQAVLTACNAALVQFGMGDGSISDISVMAATLSGLAATAKEQLAVGEAAINEARKKLDEAGAQIESGKQTIQANLEQIWYEMGQADEAEAEFAARRAELMDEAAELAAETEQLEQRKQDENKLNSTRILLRNYEGIRLLLDAGKDLPESAREYAAQLSADNNRDYRLRLAICILEIIGGAAGLACLPAAYEKSKSRALLLVPAVLALACAAAAETIGVVAGLGQVYAVMPAIIFALLYLLSAAPQKRKIEGTTLMA